MIGIMLVKMPEITIPDIINNPKDNDNVQFAMLRMLLNSQLKVR